MRRGTNGLRALARRRNVSAELNSSRLARKFSAFGAVRIPKPPRLRRRRHAPRNLSPPRPRPPPPRERAELNLSRIARKFSAFGAVRIPKPSRLRRRRHVPRNTSPPRPRAATSRIARNRSAPRPLSVRRRSAFSVAPSHLQSLFEGWQGVDCQILRQALHGAARIAGTLSPRSFTFWAKTSFIY